MPQFLTCIRTMLAAIAFSFAALGLTAAFTTAHAAQPEIYRGLGANTAVGGYDPVAYFTEGKPVKGDAAFTHTYKGISWRFASAANRDAFKAAPAKYEPQYGGYCAWAVSQGYTAKGDPRFWRIVDGKLYLNYNQKVQNDWNKDAPGFITKANANWPNVLKK